MFISEVGENIDIGANRVSAAAFEQLCRLQEKRLTWPYTLGKFRYCVNSLAAASRDFLESKRRHNVRAE